MAPIPGLRFTQAVKRRKKGRIVGIEVRAVIGDLPKCPYVVYVERLNGVLRDRLNALTRKTHGFAKLPTTWDAQEPLCPHCPFRPATDMPDRTVQETLREADSALDRWAREWAQTLGEVLSTPTAQASLALMTPQERMPLEALRDRQTFPDPLDTAFLERLKQALRGLERVTIPAEDILQALTRPGMPCTVEELQRRFEHLLQERLGGKDPERVRVVIDW